MVSVPMAAGPNNTVGSVFGVDLPNIEYGSTWAVFALDAATDTQGSSYQRLTLTSRLAPGEGYWILQRVAPAVQIDLPANAAPVAPTPGTLTGCVDAPCLSIELATRRDSPTWSLLGSPSSAAVKIDRTYVVTDDARCNEGCTLGAAFQQNVLNDILFHYVDSDTGYRQLTGNGELRPWEGFWIRTLANPNANSVRLIVPLDTDDAAGTSTLSVKESSTLTLRTDIASNSSTVEWTQIDGPPTYFSNVDGPSLTLVTPSVGDDVRVTLQAASASSNGTTRTERFNLDITNRQPPILTSAPPRNVYASGNLDVYDGYARDSSGLPLIEVDGRQEYYVVTIAQWAFDLYANYLRTGSESMKQDFVTAATWMRDQCVYTPYGFCSMRVFFPQASHGVDDDWTTAMGQGLALSSLIAAHHLTGDPSFADTAYDSLAAYLYPVGEKGLYSFLSGQRFYEEYGSPTSPSHVLNGFLFSQSGIHDFLTAYDEDYAREIFNTGNKTLADNIERWDLGFTSRYDLAADVRPASAKSGPDKYHELHVFQLAWLYTLTDNTTFLDMAERFLAQDMGGLASIDSLFDTSRELLSISASRTIEPIEYGTDRLTDANWTWQKYWSTNRFPTTLDLQVNLDIVAAGKLDALVLAAVADEDIPTSFDLLQVDADGNEQLLRAAVTPDDAKPPFTFTTGGYTSRVLFYPLDVPVSSSQLRLVFNGSAGGQLLRLRELDLQYDRPGLMDRILGFYR